MTSNAPTCQTNTAWSWREWFSVSALVLVGLLVCATDSAWGLVVAVPAVAALALALGVEATNRRR